MDNYDVVVAGTICLDLTPTFKEVTESRVQDIFVPGKLRDMDKLSVSTGGPVSNTGLNLIKLGIGTRFMGKIGRDFIGSGVLGLLGKYDGAADSMRVVEGEDTSYTVVIVPKGFDRIFLHCGGANHSFGAEDIDYDVVSRAKIFHLGYPTIMKRLYENNGSELIRIFKRVKELGVTTSLDMSLPDPKGESGRMDWDAVLRELLPYVDIYLPSAEETMYMIDRPEYERLLESAGEADMLENLDINALSGLGKRLLSYGSKIVAVKSGVKGFYLATAGADRLKKMGKAVPADMDNWANRELHEESFKVPVVSATGSGDSAIAGFLAAYLKGMPIEEALKAACCVGGQNVQVLDAVSGVKTFDETVRLMRSWPKNKLAVAGDYFRYIPEKQVFAGKGDRLHG
jgi:sugar/nucleoside kinase (ribokinase family)